MDKNGELWSGGTASDRVLRFDPRSGRATEYLLPRPTNIRRVFVDNSTNPVTFWAGKITAQKSCAWNRSTSIFF
jgi:virginiamycin B lyase